MSWEENVRRVEPYVPGEQPKEAGAVIKLNTNEFPYPPTPLIQGELKKFHTDLLRLYPNTTAEPLVEALAGYYGFEKDEIFVGVGSDDVLANSFLTFFHSGKPVLFPDVTYSFYDVWAKVYGIPYERQPLDADFRISEEDYYKENGGIVIANPNAPTGISEPVELIEEIVKHNSDSVVIIDEAYVDFGGESAMELTRNYDNLLVVQTFSKSRAFAGMRIGFAIGNKKLIRYLNDVKFSINSYTMNQPAIYWGIKAVEDEAYFRETLAKVIATRERCKAELAKLGFACTDSKTNFIFASHKRIPAKELFTYLRTKQIYVRYFEKPRIDNYLRITVGTNEQMDALLKELRLFIAG